MELNSFRDLLLKKAEDNLTLQTIISVMKDELIADHVIESLEKMARPHASSGRHANAAVTAFANSMKNKDVEMMRDALGHHIAHHKAALKAGNRQVADEHLKRIVPLMHLASKATAHSGGQMMIDYPPMEAYETNYTGTDRSDKGDGKLHEGTKGLGRRLSSVPRSKNVYSVPDYRYLEMPPHPGHEDTNNHKDIVPHKEHGYPFEEIQLGNPAKVDAKEAYLHIPNVDATDNYVAHPFDHHPVNEYITTPQNEMEHKMGDFANQMSNWHEHEQNKKWMSSLKDQHAADPEGFKNRGKTKSEHHFTGIPLLEQEDRVKQGLSHKQERQGKIVQKDVQEKPKPSATTITRKASDKPLAEPGRQFSPEEIKAIKGLPQHIQDKIFGKKGDE